MKSTVTPVEILETIKNLPALAPVHPEMAPQDRLKAILDAHPESAFVTRLLIFSIGAPDVAQKLLDGGMPIHETAQALDADMQMIEMDTDTTAAEDNARAVAFGLMAAEPNTGMIVTTAIGPQETPADFWQDATPNVAAILGAMISGATANIPVIAEGPAAVIAADMLATLRPDMMQYVFVCDPSENLVADGPGYSGAMFAAWALAAALEEDAA